MRSSVPWGTHGAHRMRGPQVEALLRAGGYVTHHLGLSKHGHPKHPLYISYDTKLVPWDANPKVDVT